MANKPDAQALPGKDAALFRTLVKLYETKQFKKGIKTADQILKKHPDHGETLAMKGLISNSVGKREEAYELTRKGLKSNLKSHVCWHVYGLIYRADGNYDEAIKCYKNALRIEKDNLTILRDLALLQVQMRDIPGFIESRQLLLKLKPNSRPNWISMAVAHHLNGRPEVAAHVLGAYENIQEEVAPGEAYEHSEMLLYKAQLLEEAQDLEGALKHLEDSRKQVVDNLGSREQRARIFLQLNRREEAEQIYRKLLEVNPDNYKYHEGLRTALQLPATPGDSVDDEQRGQLEKLYAGLSESYPKSAAVRRIPLDFLVGSDFEAAAEQHVQRFLKREIPSLFSDIKPLYRDPAKQEALQLLLERLHSSAEASSKDAPSDDSDSCGPAVWTKLYLAQHHDHLGDTGKAVTLLKEALALAPRLIELHTAMAKVLKHAGDAAGAAEAAVRAQNIDLADRYLNSTAAKFLFRADRILEAQRMAARFTKDGEQASNLYDMQCTWYEIECGNAHLRRKELGQALKKFVAVRKHFEDFQEDQFDFHGYCARKMTLRSYIQMLQMQDRLYHNIAFSKAAWGAIETYLQLFAGLHKADSKAQEGSNGDGAELSAEQKKKQKQRQRKEAQKQKKGDQQREKEETDKAGASPAQQKAGAKKDADPDPLGKELASVSDPLEEAAKLVRTLREHAGDRLQTHEWAFKVYMLKGKFLLALQATKRAIALEGRAHPSVHRMIVQLCHAVQAQVDNAQAYASDPLVAQIISEQTSELLEGKSLADHCDAYVREHASASLAHALAAAEALAELNKSNRQQAAKLLLDALASTGRPRLKDCISAQEFLLNDIRDSAAAEQWQTGCQKLFHWSSYFNKQPNADSPQANGIAEAFHQLDVDK